MNRIILTLSILIIHLSGLPQSKSDNPHENLIDNSEFNEFITYLDSNYNIVYEPKYWFYNNEANPHPIYYCTNRFLDKSNVNNRVHPDGIKILQGEFINYVGIPILPKPEKIYTKLKSALQKDSIYNLKIDIKSYDYSNCYSDLIVSLSDSLSNKSSSDQYKLILTIPDTFPTTYFQGNWINLSLNFRAKGGEQYLTIGSGSIDDYKKIVTGNLKKFDNRNEYVKEFCLKYCIDNVIIKNSTSVKTIDLDQVLNLLNIGESINFDNILFEFNKSELLQVSFSVLDQLVSYLNRYQNVNILIIGHTDNYGVDVYNQELSISRAKSVSDYLIDKGISNTRIQFKGMGCQEPITTNDTEVGRSLNRRVEIKIIKK
jgi:OmpA-OmpF porin, OOP family